MEADVFGDYRLHLMHECLFDSESFKSYTKRDAVLMEEIEGYAAPGCWHTKSADPDY